jgi:fructose-1,6-bisphosphatase I
LEHAVCQQISLETYLGGWSASSCSERRPVAAAVLAVAHTARQIADLIARGPLAGPLGAEIGTNVDGDVQRELDLRANALLIAALRATPVAAIASEELDEPLVCDESAPLLVALDPLDGSSNIDTDVSIGTIFYILPAPADTKSAATCAFLQPGSRQIAAGYVIYGPQCALVLTVGKGTHIFTLERTSGEFRLTRPAVQIPASTREYAINASNHRHWSGAIRAYFSDCIEGEDGPRGKNFNTRWIASLVAECHRILARGGVFLYPADARKGYQQGRLRLLYEANPIALLIEQAGGKAIDSQSPILEVTGTALHQRTPLIFGSRSEVELVSRYVAARYALSERAPLFGQRGLFRA